MCTHTESPPLFKKWGSASKMPMQWGRLAITVLQQSHKYCAAHARWHHTHEGRCVPGKEEGEGSVEWGWVHGCASGHRWHACIWGDDGRNIKVMHCNWLFLVATPQSDATPLGGSKSLLEESAGWSDLAELTPLEQENEAPESEVDEEAALYFTSHVLLGWVDGILWPLPSVAPRTVFRWLGASYGT